MKRPATLLVLLTLFAAQTVFGHGNHNNPCTGHHSNDPGCETPDPARGFINLVVDIDGDIVGTVVGIENVSGSSGSQPPVLVHVMRDGRYLGFIGSRAANSSVFDLLDMNHGNRGPFFTQPDCQGTPYLELESNPTQALFLNYYYQDPIDGHGVIAVLDDQSQTPQVLTFQSSAGGIGGACVPNDISRNVVALTIDQTGLPLFQPNYSIVAQ